MAPPVTRADEAIDDGDVGACGWLGSELHRRRAS
jgi:hypothetical protein